MAIRIVQSKQNGRVKELRAALLHPPRSAGDLIALEGVHLLAEALRSGIQLVTVFVEQRHEHLLGQLRLDPSVEVLTVPRDVLVSAVTTETPQPIAALALPHAWKWPDVLKSHPAKPDPAKSDLAKPEIGRPDLTITAHTPLPPLLMVLSGVQDPGNLGTILRSAEAFGATGAVCLPGTVSLWNAKALRASAGSAFRLPVIAATEAETLLQLREAGIHTIAAMAHDAHPLGHHDLTGPVALMIGSEGSGLTSELAEQCDARITIHCPGPVESLNAAVAASILLFEAARQRTRYVPKKRRSPE